ncbi:DUF4817 domain-containing protein [Trichonephila clavipes]|nr:DUF4817 domain-containing protein [Trichonephila clavipes]
MNSSQHRCINQVPASENQTQQRSLNSSLEATVGSPLVHLGGMLLNGSTSSLPNSPLQPSVTSITYGPWYTTFATSLILDGPILPCTKNVKSGKGPLTPAGLSKFVKRFEETGKLEDRARACIAVEMEAIASEAVSGTSSAREAARRLGLPPSSVDNILRQIFQLYPYKLQSCHELLPADTEQREAFAKGLL